jgi:hypothetical protein
MVLIFCIVHENLDPTLDCSDLLTLLRFLNVFNNLGSGRGMMQFKRILNFKPAKLLQFINILF